MMVFQLVSRPILDAFDVSMKDDSLGSGLRSCLSRVWCSFYALEITQVPESDGVECLECK